MSENRTVTFSDYLSVLFKWRKFLIITLLSITVITTVISFLIPKTYKATATVMLPPENSMGLGGLSSLLSGAKSALSLGAAVFGTVSTNEDVLLGLLYSRNILTQMIHKYNLIDYYSISDSSIDRTIKAFLGDLDFDMNEYGFIEVSVINEDPNISAQMANDFVRIADSLNVVLNTEQARRHRIYIEKRYLQNLDDLQKAEEAFRAFQEKYGVYDVPEQVKVAIQSLGALEVEVIKKQIILAALKENFPGQAKQVKDLDIQIKTLKQKLDELYTSKKQTSNSIFVRMKDVPKLQMEYVRLYRDLEIQNQILEFIYPMYEQAKIEEQKSQPTILVVDKAVPPDDKYAPKKAFIILFVFFLAAFILIPLTFRINKLFEQGEPRNAIEEKELKFYTKYVKNLFNIQV